MNDIVFEESDAMKAQSLDDVFDCEPSESQSLISRMQPFKCWVGDEIKDFPYGLYRALLIPGHHQLTDDDNNNHLDRTRSIFYSGNRKRTFILKSELIQFKLLKVLDLSDIEINDFPLQLLSLIWLRYLRLSLSGGNLDIPPEICRLWNLQTFIVRGQSGKVTFPEQIWRIVQLRHLTSMGLFNSFVLPDCPSISVDRGKNMGFSNIQTIFGLSPDCWTKEVILGIQNVKKLSIYGKGLGCESFWNNLVYLHQLESLCLLFIKLYSGIPSAKVFPATLKKLKLLGTDLSWSELDIIAELPNLEVLKLMQGACWGKEWDPNGREFTRLKLLLIWTHGDLKYWKVTNDNFPILERLFIRYCPDLEEIPIEFAEIHSLQLIELTYCTSKVNASARRIQQEQEELGNKSVDVRIIKHREE